MQVVEEQDGTWRLLFFSPGVPVGFNPQVKAFFSKEHDGFMFCIYFYLFTTT
jgi:hypothetical protein